MTTLAMVGNAKQSFHRLLNAIGSISASLPQPVIVQHGSTPFQDTACECHAFMNREATAELVRQSDLIICHAGAGTVIEAIRAGHKPVVMPRRRAFKEHVDDHQLEFATMLRETGKAIVIDEPAQLAHAVKGALDARRSIAQETVEPLLVGLIRDALLVIESQRTGKRDGRCGLR